MLTCSGLTKVVFGQTYPRGRRDKEAVDVFMREVYVKSEHLPAMGTPNTRGGWV